MAGYITYVGVAAEDIELDYALIDGALNLMAFTSGNNTLDEVTIKNSQQLKRIVAQKLEDESRIKVTANPSQFKRKGNKKNIKIKKSHQHEEASTRSRPKPCPSSVVRTELPALPSLPSGSQGLIGPCSLPTQKQLTNSDVKHSLCRLMLPRPWALERLKDMVNPDECKRIEKFGTPVIVYGPDGRDYAMNFVSWKEEKFYVLNSKMWKRFCQDYGLGNSKSNMETLAIWMFRHIQTNDLCFAITW